ncbi:cytochrome c [Leptospira sp. 2 VSF19]|uniref:Cytochrome c n=1 Tax=Leptospira soteropolitanensis TaxID=2950025 RepID=A0AAW5VJG9_9LEPT|nr:cytochrome c [Leptospira soteropolitanensis]MCW7491184.1 cytochrome c [Leptospira soteropolitanensis]MCW7498768.1 cytochrome c [Leptospira soteropolitanensis]MCW7521639.1 cytochrome c [Leptospira soteropolitanensis]MCW7524872.1 cytochrome c [Leptospira soteropolitanensis]MCW7528739.1 cytochrome c [Leptospira soteropolitanensis]
MKNLLPLIFLIVLSFSPSCTSEDETPKKEPPPPPAVTVPFPEAMYVQNGCASCHGIAGNGRGTRTQVLSTSRIPNFQDKSTYIYGSSKEAIAKSIKNGIPGTYMKAYSHMRKSEIDAVAEYIQKMQK